MEFPGPGTPVVAGDSGVLYIVATPIGNLADLSPRALEVLRAVDVIAAEDTRHSARLLRHFGITTPCIAVHEHNERQAVERLVSRLEGGDSVALISDAGTPLLSDPGYHLVGAAHEHRIRVIPVPGPSSVVSALSAAGFAVDRFVFEGFLPARQAARRARLAELKDETRTLVLFEAPHRIAACLDDLVAILGAERMAVLARELTKIFETVRRDRLATLADWVRADPDQQKGEIVVVLQGAPPACGDEADALRILDVLLDELPLKQAVALANRLTDLGKNRLYEFAVKRKDARE